MKAPPRGVRTGGTEWRLELEEEREGSESSSSSCSSGFVGASNGGNGKSFNALGTVRGEDGMFRGDFSVFGTLCGIFRGEFSVGMPRGDAGLMMCSEFGTLVDFGMLLCDACMKRGEFGEEYGVVDMPSIKEVDAGRTRSLITGCMSSSMRVVELVSIITSDARLIVSCCGNDFGLEDI